MKLCNGYFTLLAVCAAVALAGCPPRGPVLDVSVNTLHFPCDSATGVCETVLTFEVGNSGSGTLVFSVSADQPWIGVSPASGNIEAGEGPVTLEVTIDREYSEVLKSGFPEFSTGVVTVQSDNSKREVVVTTAPNYFTQVFQAGNDLDGLELNFQPDGSLSFYAIQKQTGITDFPTDPSGGQMLPFDDPDFVSAFGDPVATVPLGGKTVPFYGKSYDTLYVSSQGYVAFGEPGNVPASPGAHFAAPQISALPVDATQAGSMVSLLQDAQKVTVTYENVPTAGVPPLKTSENDFQVELFFNGNIRISYVNVDPTAQGVVGLSSGQGQDGQAPDQFFPTDLSGANTGALKVSLD